MNDLSLVGEGWLSVFGLSQAKAIKVEFECTILTCNELEGDIAVMVLVEFCRNK